MALVSAAMSFHTGARPLQKGFWIIVIGLFLWVELTAIRKDRQKSDADAVAARARADETAAKDRTERDKDFSSVLLAQEQDFERTEGKLRAVIRNDQTHFDATIGRVNGVLDKTSEVASISQRNLDAVLGTNSVPCVTPRVWESRGDLVFLNLNVEGQNTLTGVNVNVSRIKALRDALVWSERVGTVSPGNRLPLLQTLGPFPADDRQVGFVIDITTQNGQYQESLEILTKKNGQRGYKWSLHRESPPYEAARARDISSPMGRCSSV